MSVQPCTRWIVVFVHDGQPVEGWMYVHKHKAEAQAAKSPQKYRVEEVCVMSRGMFEALLQPA